MGIFLYGIFCAKENRIPWHSSSEFCVLRDKWKHRDIYWSPVKYEYRNLSSPTDPRVNRGAIFVELDRDL